MKDKPLELANIQLAAESCSAQELIAALVWQRQFNEFDGKQVVRDLISHSDLWSSFLFTKQIFSADRQGLTDTLVSMANNRYQKIEKNNWGVYCYFAAYPADTLYILTKNQDALVIQLVDLGKKWQADSVDIYDSQNNGELTKYESIVLSRALIIPDEGIRDAVLIKFWWD